MPSTLHIRAYTSVTKQEKDGYDIPYRVRPTNEDKEKNLCKLKDAILMFIGSHRPHFPCETPPPSISLSHNNLSFFFLFILTGRKEKLAPTAEEFE